MLAKSPKAAKTQALVELGIRKHEIATLLKIYNVEDEKPISHTIGVEIECFGVNKGAFLELAKRKKINIKYEGYNHDTKQHYKIVSDSSIIGIDPIECVSPILTGKRGLNSLNKALSCLNAAGAKVNENTGLHVHVGLKHISMGQYKNIFINYRFLEPAIDKFMAMSRRANNNEYCKTLANSNPGSICRIFEFKYHDMAAHYYDSRYYKLNPVSFRQHGTLEFRHHHGTTNYEDIEAWIKFVVKLVDYSKKHILNAHIENIDDIPFITCQEKQYFNTRAAELSSAELNEVCA